MLPSSESGAGLREEMTALEYAACTVADRIERMLVLAPAVRRGDDEDALRQMRIASRRVRAALDAYEFALGHRGLEELRREVKAITRTLGRARDLDMMADSLRKYATELPHKHQDAIQRLVDEVGAERAGAQRAVRQAVGALENAQPLKLLAAASARRGALSRASVPAVSASTVTRASLVVNARIRELLSYERVLVDAGRVEDLHDMRSAVKRLRYTLEAYEPLLSHFTAAGEPVSAAIDRAKDLQDRLGHIHDADVIVPWITERLARALKPGYGCDESGRTVSGTGLVDYQACQALVALCEAYRADRKRRYQRLLKGWNDLRASGFFEGLPDALRAAVREAALRPPAPVSLRLVSGDAPQPATGGRRRSAMGQSRDGRRSGGWSTARPSVAA